MMAGVHDQDHQPVIVDRVQDPVVTCDADPQDSVHSCEHLRARGPRIFAQRFRRGLDAFDYGPVELSQRPQVFRGELQLAPPGRHVPRPSPAQACSAGIGSAPASISASDSRAACASAKSSSSSRSC